MVSFPRQRLSSAMRCSSSLVPNLPCSVFRPLESPWRFLDFSVFPQRNRYLASLASLNENGKHEASMSLRLPLLLTRIQLLYWHLRFCYLFLNLLYLILLRFLDSSLLAPRFSASCSEPLITPLPFPQVSTVILESSFPVVSRFSRSPFSISSSLPGDFLISRNLLPSFNSESRFQVSLASRYRPLFLRSCVPVCCDLVAST